MSVNKELVKGSTSMLVLGVLEEKEMYGYQIIKELEQRSETVFSLKEGTLYPILHVLEQDGFLEAYWEDTSSARKRRFYRITKKGRKELDRQKEEWKEYAGIKRKTQPYKLPWQLWTMGRFRSSKSIQRLSVL